MVDLVRYNRRISPELPNISVNRVSSADAENMFGGAAAAVDAFLSAGEQDRIRKNIADAENIARDVQLGTTVIRDANGKEVTKYQTPEMFAGGSRSERAYNDIVRQRYQNASIEKIRQDVRQMETSNFRDPEGYQAAISAYSDALQLPPTGLLGTELTKAAALSAESIKRRRQEEEYIQARADSLIEYERILRTGDEEIDAGEVRRQIKEAYRVSDKTLGQIENDVARSQTNAMVAEAISSSNADEAIVKLNDLSKRRDELAEIFLTEPSVIDGAIAMARTIVGDQSREENVKRAQEIGELNLRAASAFTAAEIALTLSDNNPETAQAIRESQALVEEARDQFIAAGKTANYRNRGAIRNLAESLSVRIRQLQARGQEVAAEIILAPLLIIAEQSLLAAQPGNVDLAMLIQTVKESGEIFNQDLSALSSTDQMRVQSIKKAIDARARAEFGRASDGDEALTVFLNGAVQPSGSEKAQRISENAFGLAAQGMRLSIGASNEPDALEVFPPDLLRVALRADQVGGGDVQASDVAQLPPQLRNSPLAPTLVPDMAAGIIERVKAVPTSLNAYLQTMFSDPDRMSLGDAIYIYNLGNAVKSRYEGNKLVQLGFPAGMESFLSTFGAQLTIEDGDPVNAFKSYLANVPAMQSADVAPGAVWKSYTTSFGRSEQTVMESNFFDFGALTPGQQQHVIQRAKMFSDRTQDAVAGITMAAQEFYKQYARSEYHFDASNDQTKTGDRYALYPVEWLVYNLFERRGLEISEEDWLPKVQAQIDALDAKGQDGKPLVLGENVFLSYEQSNPYDKFSGVYRLREVTFGERNDRIPQTGFVLDGSIPASVDLLSVFTDLSRSASEEKIKLNADYIRFLTKRRTNQNKEYYSQRVNREAILDAKRRQGIFE